MDRFYIIGACVLAIGSVSIHLSNGATTSSTPITTSSQTQVADGSTTSSPPVPTESQNEAAEGATTSSPQVTTAQGQANDDITTTLGVTASTPPSVTDVITDVLNNNTCPRFYTRLENDTLYVSYVEGSCEMVVTVDKITLPPLKLVSLFKRRNRVIRRPAVSFRSVGTEENGEPVTCESLPSRSLGPFVFVDTLTDECQMLLKIQKQKNEAFMPRVLGEKRPGSQKGKRPREPRFTYVPALEYLDEIMY